MDRRFVSCVITVLIAVVVPMVTAQTPTPRLSGIEGVIMVSPNRPGPIRNDRPSAGPAANIEFVVKKEEARVASFTTDGEGRFRVLLPPGHYTVLREDAGARDAYARNGPTRRGTSKRRGRPKMRQSRGR